MSLAGLDAPAVVEAHHALIADSTGWFILKYQDGSRDNIEVLKQGGGGVNEARKVVEAYQEKSPLYGLVQFRRKKIILQYVPDGTSRLLQVRLKVQFQSILDTFTPHDTVFFFTQASELSESALALSTMLLPSTGSITSSSSSRRRRLNDISEDGNQKTAAPEKMKMVEEVPLVAPAVAPAPISKPEPEPEREPEREPESEPAPTPEPTPAPAPTPAHEPAPAPAESGESKDEPDELPASALRAKALLAKRKEGSTSPHAVAPAPETPASPPKPVPAAKEPSLPSPRRETPKAQTVIEQPAPTFGLEKSLPAIPIDSPPSTTEGFERITEEYLTKTNEEPQPDPEPEPEPRLSLTAELLEQSHTPLVGDRSSITQWNDDVAVYASVKPKKKKLGPRPHIDDTTRPRTSGAPDSTMRARPIANLPTTIRVSNNRTTNTFPVRPGSQQSSKSVPGRFLPSATHPPILPALPSPTHIASLYRPESRVIGSAAGSITAESAANATPEKLRLMKALQIRKRNMLIAQRTSASTQASVITQAHSESLASSHTSRGIHPSGSTVRSDGNGHLIEPTDALKQTSNTTSPTATTLLSEDPSTKASSFTSRDEAARRRESLSSDTSSSVTPKPEVSETKRKGSSRAKSPANLTPPKAVEVQKPSTKPEERVDSVLAVEVPSPDLHRTDAKSPISSVDEAYSQLTNATDQPPIEDEAAESLPSERDPVILEGGPATVTARSRSTKEPKPKPTPLQIASSAEFSEMSDNDSLMDELQNATVQEAKPVSVARTPVTPVLSRVSTQPLKDMGRAVSAPLSRPSEGSKSTTSFDKPKSAGGRSISTALPQWPPQSAEPLPLTKKSTIGSGISKRIKALEVVSSRQSTSPPRQPPRDATSATRSAFSTFTKRASLIMHQQTPNASTENSPLKRLPELPSPEKERLAEITKPWKLRHEAGGVLAPPPKGETVSVTARIVRDDPEIDLSQSAEAGDYMYRSPLIVEHDKPKRDITTAGTDTTLKSAKSERGRFSFSSHRTQSHPKLPSDSLVSRLTFSRSSNKIPRSASDNSSVAEERPKSSRAGRLMKRVSNLKAGWKSSRDLTSYDDLDYPQAIEEDERESRASIPESMLHVVDIGDVNVQFPDSLLWKRRFIRIDDQGYLIFSPPANEANFRAVSRKYHLNDFLAPALPDTELEEMANSVILDRKDGSCVQCACESKSSQERVLQMLVDAHSAYHQLYGT